MPAGPALLRAFLARHSITVRGAAAALGVFHPSVVNWSQGKVIPLEPMRLRIAIWTSGAVPETAWGEPIRAVVQPFRAEPVKANGTE